MLTKEECIEALNYLASGQCSYCWKNNGDKATDFECHESYELLVKLINEHFELVEKTTPKKVKDKKWTNGEFISLSYGKCPSCGAEAWGCDDDYCPKCGQALDWKIEVKEDVD